MNILMCAASSSSCDLALTSDCGHKLTFDPPAPRLPCCHRGPHKAASGWWKEVGSGT